MTRRKSTPTAATTPLLARALRGDGRACTRECVCARSQADILRSTFAFRDSLVDSHACSVACELASHNPSRCVRPRASPSSSAAPWVDISTKFLTVARLCTACRRRTSEICRGRHRPNRIARMHRARRLGAVHPRGRPWCGMRGDATALVHIAQEVRAVPSRHVPAGRGGRSNLHEMCSHALPEMRRLHVHAFHTGNRLHTDTSAVDCKHAGAARRCDHCLRAPNARRTADSRSVQVPRLERVCVVAQPGLPVG